MVVLILLTVLLWTPVAYAQDAGAATGAIDPASATTAHAPEPTATSAAPTPAPDLGKQLEDAKVAYDRIKADRVTSKKFLIAALIAALANILLTLLKKTARLTKQGKKYLPWAALGLGLVVGVSSYYAMGTTFVDAVLYGGGAPGAIILQELLSFMRKDAASGTITMPAAVAGGDPPKA
jgi:hypothetical protein